MFPFGYILQSCESVLGFLQGTVLPNTHTMMRDKAVSHKVPQSPTTRIPKVMVQRAEEMFPALKEGTVSVVCME
jgi:hypothetical protein